MVRKTAADFKLISKIFFVVPCDPPTNISAVTISESSVNVTWVPQICRDGNVGSARFIMYIEDSIHDSKAEWYIKGVALDHNYAVIDFLSPGVKYRAYMVQATEIGNGPPSEKFYFVAKPARKNISFYVIIFIVVRQNYVTVNVQGLYLFIELARSQPFIIDNEDKDGSEFGSHILQAAMFCNKFKGQI